MKKLTFRNRKEPGFRLSILDLFIILLLFVLSVGIFFTTPESGYFFLPIYIGYTFFIFCNIYRIGNRLEAYWYLPFILIAVLTLENPGLFWFLVLACCEPLKIALILYRRKMGNYRGIFFEPPHSDSTD